MAQRQELLKKSGLRECADYNSPKPKHRWWHVQELRRSESLCVFFSHEKGEGLFSHQGDAASSEESALLCTYIYDLKRQKAGKTAEVG